MRRILRYARILTCALLCCLLALCLRRAAGDEKNQVFQIVPAPGKVTVDGKLDEWDKSGAYGPVTFDPEFLGVNDATFYGMYDKENLYLGFRVHDPNPLLNHGTVEDGNYWLGDSIEVRFSLNPADGVPPHGHGFRNDTPDIRHLGIWYNSKRKQPQFYLKATMKYEARSSAGMQVAFTKWEDRKGWDCEVSVPWKTLGGTVRPKPGDTVGWCMAVLFGDSTGQQHWRKVSVLAPNLNFQNAGSWYSSGARFSPTGHITPNPATQTKPAVVAAAPAVARVTYDLPRAGKVSLALYGPDGVMVRSLLFGQPQAAGRRTVDWDGLDMDGKPVEPGSYNWRLAVGDGISAAYVMGLMNGGTPKYVTPDGKGGWGGIWGNVLDTAADATGVYLLWGYEEGEGALVKITPSGQVLWKQHIPYELSGNQSSLAADGERVVIASVKGLWQVSAKTGEYLPFTKEAPFMRMGGPAAMRDAREAFCEQFPEVRRIPRILEEGLHILGVALGGGKVYISRTFENRIEAYDLATAKLTHTVPARCPFALAFDGKSLYAVSGRKVLRFTPELKPAGAAVSGDLDAPFGLAVDRWGQLWVSDEGDSQQVKQFSAQGKLLRTLGRPGGRQDGRFVRTDFRNPTGLAVCPQTGQVFFGEDAPPRRVVAVDSSGAFVMQWLGPMYCGWATFVVDTEHKPMQLYTTGVGGLVRFNIDLARQTATLDAVWHESLLLRPPLRGNTRQLAGYYRRTALRHHNGKAYLCITGDRASILKIDGYTLKPSAQIGVIRPRRKGRKRIVGGQIGPFKYEDGYRGYVWRDANGNGIVELNRDELKGYKELPPNTWGYFGSYTAPDFAVYGFGGGVTRWPCVGWDKFDNPIYDWAKADCFIPALPVPYGASDSSARFDEEGNIYVGRDRAYGARRDRGKFPVPTGIDWAGRNTHADVSKMDKNGRLLWRTLKKTNNFRKPGEVYALRGGVAEYAKGCVFVDDCTSGQCYVIDRDGLVLDAVLEDIARGPAPSPYTLYVEHFTSYYFTDPSTQDLYLVTGAEDIRIYRLSGFDSYQRMTGTVSLASRAVAQSVSTQKEGDKVAAARRVTVPPVIDGDLGEWRAVPVQTMVVDPDNPDMRVKFQLAWDARNLYAAFDVTDASPMVNSARVLATCFKYGDSLDLYLACGKEPAKSAGAPIPGDVRLLLTRYGGRPLVLAYRPDVPGTANPTVFTSPVGQFRCDVVAPVANAALVFRNRKDGKGYTAELAVPLADLKPLAPRAGLKIRFDVGANFSNRSGTLNAIKIYWTRREAMVRDIPTEARFFRDKWGTLRFE